jgi:Polysaccharide lyase
MLVFASVALADQPVVGKTLSAKRAHRPAPRWKRRQIQRARVLGHRPVAQSSSASQPDEGLLFSGSRISDFADNQSAPGAVTEVPDPAGSGEKVLKMTVANDDVAPVTPTDNPRAQLVTPAFVEPGEETWWKSRFYLPKDFPSDVPGWVSIIEGPYGQPYDGSPPVSISVDDGEIRFQRGDTYQYDVAWQEPIEKGRWIEVLLHTRFGHNGFVELWVDGQQVTFFEDTPFNPLHEDPTTHLEMQTMDHTNDGGPNFFVLQNYRERNMFNSLTVYHGPTEVGTTRASVEG